MEDRGATPTIERRDRSPAARRGRRRRGSCRWRSPGTNAPQPTCSIVATGPRRVENVRAACRPVRPRWRATSAARRRCPLRRVVRRRVVRAASASDDPEASSRQRPPPRTWPRRRRGARPAGRRVDPRRRRPAWRDRRARRAGRRSRRCGPPCRRRRTSATCRRASAPHSPSTSSRRRTIRRRGRSPGSASCTHPMRGRCGGRRAELALGGDLRRVRSAAAAHSVAAPATPRERARRAAGTLGRADHRRAPPARSTGRRRRRRAARTTR